jgi:thiamine pyrophosphokinase
VLFLGGLGGRLDHQLNNIHLIYQYTKKYSNWKLRPSFFLIDNNSIATVILPGKTLYRRALRFEESEGCGIFPLTATARVKTIGLEWNLTKDKPLVFDGFVSSSNKMISEEIEIETEDPVIWTTTNCLRKKFKELMEHIFQTHSLRPS